MKLKLFLLLFACVKFNQQIRDDQPNTEIKATYNRILRTFTA